jgi:hypothetical protein
MKAASITRIETRASNIVGSLEELRLMRRSAAVAEISWFIARSTEATRQIVLPTMRCFERTPSQQYCFLAGGA